MYIQVLITYMYHTFPYLFSICSSYWKQRWRIEISKRKVTEVIKLILIPCYIEYR
jgi:hypothetical protein